MSKKDKILYQYLVMLNQLVASNAPKWRIDDLIKDIKRIWYVQKNG